MRIEVFYDDLFDVQRFYNLFLFWFFYISLFFFCFTLKKLYKNTVKNSIYGYKKKEIDGKLRKKYCKNLEKNNSELLLVKRSYYKTPSGPEEKNFENNIIRVFYNSF